MLKSWTVVGTKVALLFSVLQHGQRSLQPEGQSVESVMGPVESCVHCSSVSEGNRSSDRVSSDFRANGSVVE